MTALALNYSQNLLKVIWGSVKKTLQGIMMGYVLARQYQANEYVARKLIHDYPGHTVSSLHHMLNQKSLELTKKEFGV
jgi:hypothetical protein